MEKILRFPHKFLWGAATASYQVEGGIENNDWAKAAREGRVPVCGQACDHYNRYETDFDIAQKLGHNVHRISLEWSRIEPKEGEFDNDAIEHYKKVVNSLKRRGLTPFITLWHFTLPEWLSEKGGFENRKVVFYFDRYCSYVLDKFKNGYDEVFWVTINEPLVFAGNGYMQGKWAPFKTRKSFAFLKVIKNLIKAHKAVYNSAKKINSSFTVGIVKNNMYFHAVGINPFSKFSASFLSWFWNRRYLNAIYPKMDFIGINYYMHKEFGGASRYEKSDFGWDIYPEGIYHVLMEADQYGKPIYITENGLADKADTRREKFIVDHLREIHRAIEDGARINGYMHWSLLDNYEWAEGFKMRFGLVEIDFVTQERKIRPSAYRFKDICESNSLKI